MRSPGTNQTRTLEFPAQSRRRQLQQIARNLHAGRDDHLHRSGGEVRLQRRNSSGLGLARTRRYTSATATCAPRRVSSCSSNGRPLPPLIDQYAAARRMFSFGCRSRLSESKSFRAAEPTTR